MCNRTGGRTLISNLKLFSVVVGFFAYFIAGYCYASFESGEFGEMTANDLASEEYATLSWLRHIQSEIEKEKTKIGRSVSIDYVGAGDEFIDYFRSDSQGELSQFFEGWIGLISHSINQTFDYALLFREDQNRASSLYTTWGNLFPPLGYSLMAAHKSLNGSQSKESEVLTENLAAVTGRLPVLLGLSSDNQETKKLTQNSIRKVLKKNIELLNEIRLLIQSSNIEAYREKHMAGHSLFRRRTMKKAIDAITERYRLANMGFWQPSSLSPNLHPVIAEIIQVLCSYQEYDVVVYEESDIKPLFRKRWPLMRGRVA